jgi:hypothetical protein
MGWIMLFDILPRPPIQDFFKSRDGCIHEQTVSAKKQVLGTHSTPKRK